MTKILCEPRDVFIRGRFEGFKQWPQGATGSPFGRSVKSLFPVSPKLNLDDEPLDFFIQGSMSIVSRKLKEIVDRYQAKVEFFPILVSFRDRSLADFFFMNYLECLDCLDKEKTVRDVGGPFPDDIKRIALDESRIGNCPLFMIAKTIFKGASDRLAEDIQNAQCTGVEFKSPEEWRNAVLLGK